ncbi:hypothetical protein [Pseudomonas sp. 2995-1]|uniref:hypothetical protein n=1 Tax=Pseudomonas sp. 2995-1 TaxID=1712679 RepID=UPI000C1473A2|nr:hypothetical protein [Pseudomonas sp. 2995-1]PIB56176.1 hypothetical protein AOA61_11625 [Pseudomonas sp. 2995-1]
MKYQIGPQPELLREIGQIMVNYSECERSIHDIFRAVMSLDKGQMYLLVSKANLNAEKMVTVIKSEMHRIRPATLHDSLLEGLADFTKSIPKRNAVAHWQWAVTKGDDGLATNSLKAKPEQPPESRNYTRKDLELIAWEIARAAILLANAAICMRSINRRSLGGTDWGVDRYEFDSGYLDQAAQYALERNQSFIAKFEAEHFATEQPPSSGKDQR